jgi:hypothetical protein
MTPENPAISPATRSLSPETLVDGPWFGRVKEAYAAHKKGKPPRWLFPAVGLAVAGLLFTLGGHWRTVAYIGAAVVLTMTVLELAAPAAAAAVHRGLAIFGQWLGKFIGWIFLVPGYLVVGPAARFLTRVVGGDPLALRAGGHPSFWTWADTEKRRAKQASRMFCAERTVGGRNWLQALFVMALAGFVIGELVLRFYFGYHNPLLYQNDSHCGYRIRPNQDIVTPRGRVQINNHAMRYDRDVSQEKPAGVFRILMIGDSTLFAGEYLTNGQTYAGLVEQRLNKRYGTGGKSYEVLPIGTNAWGPLHQVGWVEKYGTFGADLTIVTTPVGDIDRGKYLLESTRFMAVKPTLAWSTMIAWACWTGRSKFATTGGDYFQSYEEGMMQFKEGSRAFAELGKLIRKTCPEVMFENLPQMTMGQDALKGTIEENSKFHLVFGMVTKDLRAAGFEMGYPQELFKDRGTMSEIFHDGAHLEKKGHDIYADYLISRIREASPGFRKYAGLPEPLSTTATAAPARP